MKLLQLISSLRRNSICCLALGIAMLLASAFSAQASDIGSVFSLDAVQDAQVTLLTAGPNPFTENVHVQLTSALRNQNVEVRVLNVIGRVVFEYNGPALQLDAALSSQSSRWPKGFYYLIASNPATNANQTLRLQKL